MNANQMANWLNDYGGDMADKAADLLRLQHEAIKTLREALAFASKYDKEMSERIVRQALEATKELG